MQSIIQPYSEEVKASEPLSVRFYLSIFAVFFAVAIVIGCLLGNSNPYVTVSSGAGAAAWAIWKTLQRAGSNPELEPPYKSLIRLVADICFSFVLISAVYFIACFIFSDNRCFSPVFTPAMCLAFGTLAAIVWEKERDTESSFQLKLTASQERLKLERDKFESELARKEAEARAREVIQDWKRCHEFVRRINHDLNAPVSTLNWTISELNTMNLESPEVREKIARLVKSSDKLCELIDHLARSYDDDDEMPSEKQTTCDLISVVDDCVDGQQPLAQRFDDIINWQKPDQKLMVKANAMELSRVLDNIIGNAITHNPKNTEVLVSIKDSGIFHKIIIEDTGQGIKSDELENIFQPGYRADPETQNKEERGQGRGSGLGLDIAKTLIASVGGEISVSSTIGEGTIFQIKLPNYSSAKIKSHDAEKLKQETGSQS